MGIASTANAASPTPALKTGNYAGQRVIVVVGDKTAYGGDGVAANKHPTTISYNATSQTYTLYDYDGGPGTSFSPGEIVASQSSAAYTFYRDASDGLDLEAAQRQRVQPGDRAQLCDLWQMDRPAEPPIHFADDYVVFGQISPASAVPRYGIGVIQSNPRRHLSKRREQLPVERQRRLSASFGTGIMGPSVTPVATNTANGTKLSSGR